MRFPKHTLVTLPVELLHEIQLDAVSPSLPNTCKYLREVFRLSPPSYRAQYLLASVQNHSASRPTKLLRYPICTSEVLDTIFRLCGNISDEGIPELPRRLFRSLAPKPSKAESHNTQGGWSERDRPLPFLRYLYSCPHICAPDVNAHEGYALSRAVYAGFIPLVRFLLDRGASPRYKDGLAITIAIRNKDLSLVRMLVERDGHTTITSGTQKKSKRLKLQDRVEVTPQMLKAAVKCDARDIVEYFTKEKGCVPNMQTILGMR